jgi:GT2 family glycosyltransferase
LNKKVYIILLNYNGWKDTIECLESVLKNDYENYQVIVVDNDSPNNSMEYIINWAEGKQEVIYDENSQLKHLSQSFESKPLEYVYYTKEEALSCGDREKETKYQNPLIFIQVGENGGFAAGNNIGIKYAFAKDDFEYIWLLNNDTVIKHDCLYQMIDKVHSYRQEQKKIGLIGAKLLYYDKSDVIQAVGGVYNRWVGDSKHIGVFEIDEGQYDFEELINQIDYPIGASMLVSKDFLIDVGLLNEEYFLYYEELDWVMRGRLKGWNIGYCWDAKVYHKEGQSIGSHPMKRSYLSEFYLFRNRLIFSNKYFKSYTAVVLMRLYLTYIKRVVFNQKSAKVVLDAIKLKKTFEPIE